MMHGNSNIKFIVVFSSGSVNQKYINRWVDEFFWNSCDSSGTSRCKGMSGYRGEFKFMSHKHNTRAEKEDVM